MNTFLRTIREFLRRVPLPVLIGVGVFLFILTVLLFIYSLGKGEGKKEISWGVLYSQLKPQDLSNIVDELENSGVPYKVADTADAIFIPRELVPTVRMKLAQRGLPEARAGLEIFEKPKFGMTEFMLEVNYQRAIQGELERTISRIEGVENSRVHIVIPKPKLFLDEQKEPTASVVLFIKPGSSVSRDAVKGIINLVSSAVEGLKPENVTITDQRGRILSKKETEEGLPELTENQIAIKRKFDGDLERKLTELLEKSVGAGKVALKVDSELDFTKITRRSERYDPLETAVRSEQKVDERFKGRGFVPIGPPGVRENVPPSLGVDQMTGKSEYEKHETIRNYEISKIIEDVVEPIGDLKRVSVAVMVDGEYDVVNGEAMNKSKKPQIKFTPMVEHELKKIEDFVKAAIGFTPARGDQVTVVSVPFEASLRYAERLAMWRAEATAREKEAMVKWAAFSFLGFLVVLYFIIRKLFERRVPKELEVLLPRPVEEVIGEIPPTPPPPTEEVAAPPEEKVAPPPPPPPVEEVGVPEITAPMEELPPIEEVAPPPIEIAPPPPPEELEERRPPIEVAAEIVKEKPDAAAEIIKQWIREDLGR